MKQHISRILLIIFTVIMPGLGAVPECLSATVEGRIVSNRIDQFENFVVYIKYVDNKLFSLPKETVLNVQKNNQVIPQVLPIAREREVIFSNEDPHFHNLHTATGGPISFNFGIPANTKYGPIKFSEGGEVMLLCDIHQELRGFILVLQNPFFSSVDKKGNFTIKKVPKGEFEIETWHNEFISKKQRLIIKDNEKRKLVKFTY